MTRSRVAVVALMALLAAGCTALTGPTSTVMSLPVTVTMTASTTASSVASTTTPSAAASTTAPTTTTTLPTFQAEILEIDEATAARMALSWHEGCPVALDELRLLHLSFHDFSGGIQIGELVVNADVANDAVAVFSVLFDAGFPIERMELMDVYQGDDEASMRANNTSAFNCRHIAGSARWSEHAYGRAVDINPLLNPWVLGTTIDPPEAAHYADRTLEAPGMIHDGDVAVGAFASIGWTWGGTWASSKDYQHFSSTGR